MRLLPSLRCLALGLLVASVPTGLSAQLRATVVDSAGRPLQGIAVEAWSGGERVTGRLSDEAGLAVFPEEVAVRTDTLRAGRFGYRQVAVALARGERSVTLRLFPEPVALEGVVADALQDPCTAPPDASGRELWEAMRSRYSGLLDTVGVATYLAEAVAEVPADRVGTVVAPEVAVDQRGSSSLLRFSWTRRIDRAGYAYPVRRNEADFAYDSWAYPPLEADLAPHFVHDLFGELHDFRIEEARPDGGWTLLFCPRSDDGDRPRLRGTLHLTPDTLLSEVRWRFITPEPEEGAGGRAVFRTEGSGSRDLLPLEGISWRKLPDSLYLQRYQQYEGWKVVPGDSVPGLPPREPAEGVGSSLRRFR